MDLNKIFERNKIAENEELIYSREFSLILEEALEIDDAKKDNDIVEIIDWYIDVIFVAVWTIYKLKAQPTFKLGPPIGSISSLLNKSKAYKDEDADWVLKVCETVIWMSLWYLYKNFNKSLVDECYNEICASNNSKFHRDDQWNVVCVRNDEWKIMKWEGFVRPDLKKILFKYWLN